MSDTRSTTTNLNEGHYTKESWLNESVFVDEFGKDYNVAEAPMTRMPRLEAFWRRGYTDDTIDGMWQHFTQYNTEEELVIDE